MSQLFCQSVSVSQHTVSAESNNLGHCITLSLTEPASYLQNCIVKEKLQAKMSKSQSRGDLQFFLPREGSAVSLPKEDSSKTTETKTIDLHIEDFLLKLNDAAERWIVDDFIRSPRFLIGDQRVTR